MADILQENRQMPTGTINWGDEGDAVLDHARLTISNERGSVVAYGAGLTRLAKLRSLVSLAESLAIVVAELCPDKRGA